jgi:peptide/nickel transport system substrate-binding protein/oligopeptide transport system substrate-binding protein
MIRLEANESYFAGRPYLNNLSFRIYQNEELEQIFFDFEQGLLDQSIIPSNKFEQVVSDAGYRKRYNLVSKPLLNLVYLGMNTSMAPFDDPRVRQAVNYAVNREEITQDITKRGSLSAKSILPPGIAGFDPSFEGYPYDKKRAHELLAEAGHPNGEGIAPIEIWTVSRAESVQKELQAYQRYLAEVGIQLVPRVAENWKEFQRLISEKKVAMFYAAWYADYPDPDNFLYVLFHSGSKLNRMGYHNAEVDALLEQGREETDYMKRAELYQLIQERVMRDAPIVSQHINSSNYLFQPWVNGIELSNLGATYLPFRNIWFQADKLTRIQAVPQGPGSGLVTR